MRCCGTAGGIRGVATANWTVEGSRDAVVLRTAWGCGGAVAQLLARGWAVGSDTGDVLRVDGRAHGCEVLRGDPCLRQRLSLF